MGIHHFIKMRFVLVLLCLISLGISTKSYDDYKIFRVHVKKSEDFNIINSLESSDKLEILKEGHDGWIDLLISPHNLETCLQIFTKHGFTSEELVKNVGRLVEEEARVLQAKPGISAGEFSYDNYHNITTIHARLNQLGLDHNETAQVFDLDGLTFEGRKIKVIRMTTNVTDPASETKPMVWVDGGIHAREWISPATVMYIIDSILGNREPDLQPDMKGWLDKYQFVIAPSINPDGYEFTKEQRLWRKTRTLGGCKDNKAMWFGGCFSEYCYGADPNRNWDVEWNTVGVSSNPCSLIYPGKAPFDQPCTDIVRRYLVKHQSLIKLYLSYHSYSQFFLSPVGYKKPPLDNPLHAQRHQEVGDEVVIALGKRFNTTYVRKQGALMYDYSGASRDWSYKELGIVDSYTVELRDTGEHGFELPPDQILDTAQENVDGFKTLLESIQKPMPQ